MDDEQCIWILEEAYADATAAAALQERMKAEPEFAARLKEAMALEQYRERLTTAIQKSPHMQQAIEQSPMMEQMQQSVESNPLLQPFQDEKVRPRRPRRTRTLLTPAKDRRSWRAPASPALPRRLGIARFTHHVMHLSFTCPNPYDTPPCETDVKEYNPVTSKAFPVRGICTDAVEYPSYREHGRRLVFSRRRRTLLGNDCRCWSSSRRCRATRARWP